LASNQLSDVRIDPLAGSAVVDAVHIAHDTKLTLVLKVAQVLIAANGFYHFDLAPPLMKVFPGKAQASWPNLNFEVSAGRSLVLDAAAPPQKLDKSGIDVLDNWSKARAKVYGRAKSAPSG
jgi:hypothetical protein